MLELFAPIHHVVAALIALLVAVVYPHPQFRCPSSTYVNGVRAIYTDGQRGPAGRFECRKVAPLIWSEEHPPYRPTVLTTDDIVDGGFIYCTGGSEPILVNEHTVGCQPR